MAISLDYRRIMHYSRISAATGQVVFKWSEYENLYRGIFQERATMHSKVYTHRWAAGRPLANSDSCAAVDLRNPPPPPPPSNPPPNLNPPLTTPHHTTPHHTTPHHVIQKLRKAKGIEFLVCDALFEARDLLGLAGAAVDVEGFLALDDRVLALVEAMRPDDTDNPAAARKVGGRAAVRLVDSACCF